MNRPVSGPHPVTLRPPPLGKFEVIARSGANAGAWAVLRRTPLERDVCAKVRVFMGPWGKTVQIHKWAGEEKRLKRSACSGTPRRLTPANSANSANDARLPTSPNLQWAGQPASSSYANHFCGTAAGPVLPRLAPTPTSSPHLCNY
ncbi:hypothetical protein AAFF_G00039420 [Aldrovandia affinis]|uniref:Uncharacterized protein n=1 Tax=Aldrovandia affinis TaxID=143900 RepID=A0AAD7WFA1_9TELE|nr:hypothetical protein AAFF_G00039420 [Aldrovandia affinis]